MTYLVNLAILVCIYVILTLALDLVVGLSGLVCLATIAFYGIGAYTTAILTTKYDWGFFSSVLCGMLLNGIIAYVVGKVLAKFKGDYYAIVSSGLAVIVFSLLMNLKDITNGALGVFGIARPEMFGFSFTDNTIFLIFVFILAVTVLLIYLWMSSSTFGLVLKALREDEKVTELLGYKTIEYKNFIFVLSAVLAGIAGAVFASFIGFIDPTSFQFKESIVLLTMIAIGGLSSSLGAVVGAAFCVLLPEILRFSGLPSNIAAECQQIIYGVMLLLVMIFRPQGIFGKYRM